MRCVRCGDLVEAADKGLRVICEECAEMVCNENGWDSVVVGGLIQTGPIEVEDLTLEGAELEDGGGTLGEPEGASGSE